jgi:hypothetical protein
MTAQSACSQACGTSCSPLSKARDEVAKIVCFSVNPENNGELCEPYETINSFVLRPAKRNDN